MPGVRAPYRNKIRTPAKTIGRIVVDLIRAESRKAKLINSNYGTGSTSTPSEPQTHDILSDTHGDTTAAAVQRGDIMTGQGAVPTLWARLPKGTEDQVLTMVSADDCDWADAAGGGLTAVGPTEVIFNAQESIDCGVAVASALEACAFAHCKDKSSGVVFSALLNKSRVAGRVTYYWVVESGNLVVKVFNDAAANLDVMVWFCLSVPPVVVPGSAIEIAQDYVLSIAPGQTIFDFTGTTVAGFDNATVDMQVYVNGLLQQKTDDYTIAPDEITLVAGIGVGERVTIARFAII